MAELIISRAKRSESPDVRVLQYSDQSEIPAITLKNTVAVITETPINNVYLLPDLYETPEIGDIVLVHRPGDTLDLSSRTVEIHTKIIVVRQYDGESWKNRDAFLFDGSAWIQISHIRLWIYNRGQTNDSLIGSWLTSKDRNGKVEWQEDNIYLYYTSTEARYISIYTSNKIDVSAYSKFVVVINNTSGVSGNSGSSSAGLVTTPYTGVSGTAGYESMTAGIRIATKGITTETTYEVDISSLEGEYHIQILIGILKINYYEVYME